MSQLTIWLRWRPATRRYSGRSAMKRGRSSTMAVEPRMFLRIPDQGVTEEAEPRSVRAK